LAKVTIELTEAYALSLWQRIYVESDVSVLQGLFQGLVIISHHIHRKLGVVECWYHGVHLLF
jgi:hypothetical protein